MRRAALVPAGLGVLLMALSLVLPWVRVRNGVDPFGDPVGPVTDEAYWLGALPGATAMVVTDWVVLLGLFAVSWRLPRWRRTLGGAAVLVLGVLALLVWGLGRNLVPPDRYLVTHLLVGAWLGLGGALLLGLGIGVLAAPSPAPSTVDGGRTGSGWSARPAWQRWWRRRGPLAALGSGALALAVVVGVIGWLTVQGPPEPRDHSGDLHRFLLPIPDDAAIPAVPTAAGNGSVQIAVVRSDVKTVAEDWYRPGHRDQLTVILERYDSDALAQDALDRRFLVEGSTSEVADVPGIPGAHSFARHSSVVVTGVRGDVLFTVVDAGDGVTVAGVLPLARDQYARL